MTGEFYHPQPPLRGGPNKQMIPSFRSEAALQLFRDLLKDCDLRNDEKWGQDGESSIQSIARISTERIDALIEALRK